MRFFLSFFFYNYFVAPGDVPKPSWRFLLYFYLQYSWQLLPFFMVFAMRTRSGTVLGALCHTSPASENRDRNITVASYPSASKDLVLVLIGSGTSHLQHQTLSGYRLSIHHVQHYCTWLKGGGNTAWLFPVST